MFRILISLILLSATEVTADTVRTDGDQSPLILENNGEIHIRYDNEGRDVAISYLNYFYRQFADLYFLQSNREVQDKIVLIGFLHDEYSVMMARGEYLRAHSVLIDISMQLENVAALLGTPNKTGQRTCFRDLLFAAPTKEFSRSTNREAASQPLSYLCG